MRRGLAKSSKNDETQYQKLQNSSVEKLDKVKTTKTLQYYDVNANPRWRTAAISNTVKLPYLCEMSINVTKFGVLKQRGM